MSFAIVHGAAHASQLALDAILDDVIASGGTRASQHEGVTAAELLLHCFKQSPKDVFLINGVNGETHTKEQILKWSISLARVLRVKCATKKRAVCLMRNHRQHAVLYYGFIFAGVVPLMLEPSATVSEISYFLKLADPAVVFCDAARRADAAAAVDDAGAGAEVVAIDDDEFDRLIADASDDVDSFQVRAAQQDDAVVMLPTSGSTGMPKASVWNHCGIVAQLPTMWIFHSFPLAPQRLLLLSTSQWATHSMAMLTAPVYRAQLLVLPRDNSPSDLVTATREYQATWLLLSPSTAAAVGDIATPGDLASVQILFVTGAPFGANAEAKLRSVLPMSAHLCLGFGMTEMQGFVSLAGRAALPNSLGRVLNIVDYKLVNNEGLTVASTTSAQVGASGELYLRGRCVFAGYHGAPAANREAFTDGWMQTGDVFQLDEQGDLVFRERKKFWFKFNDRQIAPEEIERALCGVAGVSAAVVLLLPGGPGALLQVGGIAPSRDHVHAIMREKFSAHKQLRGGIAFVPDLPVNAVGKPDRRRCRQLAEQLLAAGDLR